MNNSIIEELLDKNDVIMIDTCFAMRDEFTQFIDSIEIELLVRRKKILVKSVVMAELYRHIGSNDDRLRRKATSAVSTICMKRNIFSIDEENISTEAVLKAFADVEFIADFTKSRIKYRMALLTNDYKLGKDIKELNKIESCCGKKVEVYSLNRFGCLEERIYDKEICRDNNEMTQNIEQENKDESKTEVKIDWTSVAISSVVSFAMGFVVNRYGKNILNKVVSIMV